MSTYHLEVTDHDTGLCMLWKAVPQNVMDWVKAEQPGPSAISEVLGPAHEVYYPEEDRMSADRLEIAMGCLEDAFDKQQRRMPWVTLFASLLGSFLGVLAAKLLKEEL